MHTHTVTPIARVVIRFWCVYLKFPLSLPLVFLSVLCWLIAMANCNIPKYFDYPFPLQSSPASHMSFFFATSDNVSHIYNGSWYKILNTQLKYVLVMCGCGGCCELPELYDWVVSEWSQCVLKVTPFSPSTTYQCVICKQFGICHSLTWDKITLRT